MRLLPRKKGITVSLKFLCQEDTNENRSFDNRYTTAGWNPCAACCIGGRGISIPNVFTGTLQVIPGALDSESGRRWGRIPPAPRGTSSDGALQDRRQGEQRSGTGSNCLTDHKAV